MSRLELLLVVLLIIGLVAGPLFASRYVHLWAGVAAAILALPVWIYFGPKPMPGFLNGLIAMNGLFLLLCMMILAVLRAI